MVKARILRRIVGDDMAAGAEVFTHHPEAATAAAIAEDEEMTEEERREVVGELPDRTVEYCARAFTLVDGAVAVLELPPDVAGSIHGDMIALMAASLLVADVREAGRELDDDSDDSAEAA